MEVDATMQVSEANAAAPKRARRASKPRGKTRGAEPTSARLPKKEGKDGPSSALPFCLSAFLASPA